MSTLEVESPTSIAAPFTVSQMLTVLNQELIDKSFLLVESLGKVKKKSRSFSEAINIPIQKGFFRWRERESQM